MGIGAGSRRPGSVKGAFGPVIATSRADYEAAGGHESVRGEVVEDMALARAYASKGLPVGVLLGSRDLSFRMYPDGLRSLVEGWTKNLATGASRTPPLRLGGAVVWLTAMGSAFFTLVRGVGELAPTLTGPALCAAFALQLRLMFSRLGNFSVLAHLLFPIQLAVFFFVFFRSLWLTLFRRRVRWRGREVPIPTGRAVSGGPR
jgi:4,4'-diaponeurosporenoate glycosyltransferase